MKKILPVLGFSLAAISMSLYIANTGLQDTSAFKASVINAAQAGEATTFSPVKALSEREVYYPGTEDL